MSDDLFDDERESEDDLFEQDGPGLFDEPPVQDGPGLFDEPAADPEGPSLDAPESTRRERSVDTAPEAPLALYRRYRPDTFADVIGQEHVTEPLQRALVNNRVNHAYLFSGPRGCGKTTSARILARCLNCEQGPTPTPCGECQSCRDLARGGGGSIDVIEIDAASHGGVDDARDLRERAFFAPVHSRYKIYIIDEAHMVTSAGFNALLKLVEEPPPHVKFIFATTEPEKVIGTIRSRTHHYPFRLVPPKTLMAYLASLCESEGVAVDHAVLPLVVRAGAGSVRDSLSVLDQLLGGAEDGGVSYQQAIGLLGYTPDSLLDRIVDAFAAGDSAEVFATIDAVIEQGQDPRRFAEDLLRRLRDLVVIAAVDDAIGSGLIDVAADQAERLNHQAAGMGLGELTRAAEVISVGLTEMRGTTAPRLHLELMCARVLLPGADSGERGIHARLDRLERRLGMGDPNTPAPAPQWDDVPPRSAAPQSAERPAPQAAERPAPQMVERREPQAAERALRAEAPDSPAVDVAAHRPAGEDPAPQTRAEESSHPSQARAASPTPAPVAEPAAAPASPAPEPSRLTITQVRQQWPMVLERVKERRRFTWIMLSQNAQVVDVQGHVLTLGMQNMGARESWERGGNADVLADVLVDVLGVTMKVEAIVDPSATPSEPAPARAPQRPNPGAAQPPVAADPTPSQQSAPSTPEQSAAEQRDVAPRPAHRPDPREPVGAPPEALEAARANIRPTREAPVADDPPEEPDVDFDPDDPDMNVAAVSSDELLRGMLGAQPLGEEDL